MDKSDSKPSREELIKNLSKPGWKLETDGKGAAPVKNRTLEEVVRTAYERHKRGEEPGLIGDIENEIELDLLQLQELWMHLGLPM